VAKPATPAELGVAVGQILLDKYRVDSVLGHGGMGVVCACTHLGLNERVAIKMLRHDVLTDVDAVERFDREARAAAKLKSEYVARVVDVGTLENGVPFMVMEFLDGLDLGQLIEQRGVLPVPWACELMLQTCEALAEAHANGIVHRDVKPTNLFVTWRPDGSAIVKVLDFGISKSANATDMHLTQTQSVLGTPAYMSPEQMRSARLVDARSDIWSLGSVFYELLEGRRPFEADSFSEMCVKVACDQPTPMTNAPPPLQQVIMTCLAKAPEQRYANMAELARDLVPFVVDQRQASVLVERMFRLARRNSWDSDITSGGRARLDSGVAPAMRPSSPNPAWSDPAGRYAAMGRAMTPMPSAEQPLTTARTRKRSVWPLVFVLAAAVGLGVALALTLDTGGGDDSSRERAASPTTTTPTTTQPPEPVATKPEPAKVVEPQKPAEIVKAAEPAKQDEAAKQSEPAKAVVEDKPRSEQKKQRPKQGVAQLKPKDKTSKTSLMPLDPKNEPKAEPKEWHPPAGLNCDPANYLHGLPAECHPPKNR
jgi:serine/threonine-protein kinase